MTKDKKLNRKYNILIRSYRNAQDEMTKDEKSNYGQILHMYNIPRCFTLLCFNNEWQDKANGCYNK